MRGVIVFKLENLRQLHKEMKKDNLEVSIFDFEYNEVPCAVLFNADYTSGFSVTFFKKSSGRLLKIAVHTGYLLDIQPIFKELYPFFELKRGKGQFSIKEFVEYFNVKIPPKPAIPSNSQKEILGKLTNIEESEKIYFKGFINWEKVRIENPTNKKGRTKENLEKTRVLYPDIYAEIKNHDISVKYTSNFKESEKYPMQLLKKELTD